MLNIERFESEVGKPTIYGALPLIRAAVDENIKGGEYFGPSKGKLPDVVESNPFVRIYILGLYRIVNNSLYQNVQKQLIKRWRSRPRVL